MADAGTTTSETITEYPASGRKVTQRNGQVVNDTKNDQAKQKETKAESESGEQVEKKEETKKEETVTKEETKKDASLSKEEDKNKDDNGNEKPNQPQEEDVNAKSGSLEDRLRKFESDLKNTSKTVDFLKKDNRFLRTKIITDKINGAHWLKPEQKEERIKRYSEMDISTEDLVYSLDDAFGAQVATVKAQPNREKQSSTQYHEDDNDSEVTASATATNEKPKKLTLDLIRPRNK
jgi:hypothetical protein